MSILKSVVFGFFFLPSLFRLDTVQVKPQETILLKPGLEYKQTFVSHHNGLYQIKVFAHNPKLSYKESLLFKLMETKSKQKMAEIAFSGLNVGTNMWVPFRFVNQESSLGKEYTFSIFMPNDVTKGSSLELMRAQEGDLLFKSYYKTSIFGFLQDSLSDFFQRISQDKIFLTIYVGLMLFVTALTVYVFRTQ